jgi:raffinose/stachyose/melibiose transport system permease protein
MSSPTGTLMEAESATEPTPQRPTRRKSRESGAPKPNYWLSAAAIVVFSVVFLMPFAFIVLTAVKSQVDSATRSFSWPTSWHFLENLQDVLAARDYIMIVAFINSTIITVVSVTVVVVLAAMAAFILQRRRSRWTTVVNVILLSGLVLPPAVVPTIWVMQELTVFKTLHGLILVEIAYGMSFCVLLFQAFLSSVPRELDEAAVIDGAGPLNLFFRVVLPLLRPVIVTIVVVQSVFVWNDFPSALYFLPGDENATVQLTLFNFQSQYNTAYNLLFMDILLVTIPPLILFLFFQRQIVSGMTAGSVKG